MDTKPKRPGSIAFWSMGIVLLATVAALSYWILHKQFSSDEITGEICDQFRSNRNRYDAIVGTLTSLQLSESRERPSLFEVSADRLPETLKAHDSREPGASAIWSPSDAERLVSAWREPDRRLVVKFISRATRHGGIWYLVYSNPPPSSGAQLQRGEQLQPIDQNWCVIYSGND